MPTNTRIDSDNVLCTCGVSFKKHKTGRCADVIIHRLAYREVPELYPSGATYSDGLRDQALFDEDWLYIRDGTKHLLPQYTKDQAAVLTLLNKWYDIGGTGHFNMNRSGWSGQFNHGILRGYWGYHNLIQSRLEWLSIRVIALRWIDFLRMSRADDCDWIEGIDPVVEEPEDAD